MRRTPNGHASLLAILVPGRPRRLNGGPPATATRLGAVVSIRGQETGYLGIDCLDGATGIRHHLKVPSRIGMVPGLNGKMLVYASRYITRSVKK